MCLLIGSPTRLRHCCRISLIHGRNEPLKTIHDQVLSLDILTQWDQNADWESRFSSSLPDNFKQLQGCVSWDSQEASRTNQKYCACLGGWSDWKVYAIGGWKFQQELMLWYWLERWPENRIPFFSLKLFNWFHEAHPHCRGWIARITRERN